MRFRHTPCKAIVELPHGTGDPSGVCHVCGRCWDCAKFPSGDDHECTGTWWCPNGCLAGIDYLVSTTAEYAEYGAGIGKGIYEFLIEAGATTSATNVYIIPTIFPSIWIRATVRYDLNDMLDHFPRDYATVELVEREHAIEIVRWTMENLGWDDMELLLWHAQLLCGRWSKACH